MQKGLTPVELLEHEARALLMRIANVRPFALEETMVLAAAPSAAAQRAIDGFMRMRHRELRERVKSFIDKLRSPEASILSPELLQRAFTFLRLRFHALLSQYDLFSDAITQRSEREAGIWLAGLDHLAAEALALPDYYQAPPVLCYLDRGPGAAIRRARTRLPGGGENPVALIRVPRERMVGSGVGSSLIHEVGHQAASLLDLVPSVRAELAEVEAQAGADGKHWSLWSRWIGEILSDFWGVAKVGAASTLGLMAIVSLPLPFVFRLDVADPHPTPWIRMKLSCAIGDSLYPHPQWKKLEQTWESYYPRSLIPQVRRELFDGLEATIPALVELIGAHRPRSLRGASLREVVADERLQPVELERRFVAWKKKPREMLEVPPPTIVAALGQARLSRLATPELETRILSSLLTRWALFRTT